MSTVEGFYPSSRRVASRLRPRSAADYDDLVQEGVIAAWLATETERQDPSTYGYVAAKHRIRSFVTGRYAAFGSEAPRGTRIHEPLRHSDRITKEENAPEGLWEPDEFPFDVEVREAVRALPREEDREQVYLMFWAGMSQPETARQMGLTLRQVNDRWTDRIRPALRAAVVVKLETSLSEAYGQ